MVLVYVAFSTSTVLPIGGTTPVHLSGLRSPAQTTSKTFSKLWPLLLQPFTIWMRSRLPEVGSLTAQTMNVGALPLVGGRSLPIGTPFAYPVFTQSAPLSEAAVYSHPPNRRTLMCGPLTANVSLRFMPSKSDARVFSSAQTPVRPLVPSVRASNMPPTRVPDMRASIVPSVKE